MKVLYKNVEYDLDDEIDSYFLNENLILEQYKRSKLDIGKRVDYATRLHNSDLKKVLTNKATTGSWDFARDIVNTYDKDRFEALSDDHCIIRKKTYSDYNTLIIIFPSYAGPEGRFTSNRDNVGEKIIELDTDLLIINEDPFRMPESLYPSNLMLGISNTYNSVESTAKKLRQCIKKEYKNVIIYSESKHAAAGATYAIQLSDIVTHLFIMSGPTTFNWDESPWVQKYIKWANRPEELEHQWIDMPDVQWMHLIKCYNFKKMGLSDKILSPFKYINDYDIDINYYQGKYDLDYVGFKRFLENQKLDNLNIHSVDYKISDTQKHNIKSYLDRYIFPQYIKNLTN